MKQVKVPAEVYSRISGYFRPVYFGGKPGNWNPGKTEEFRQREFVSTELIEQYTEPILSHS